MRTPAEAVRRIALLSAAIGFAACSAVPSAPASPAPTVDRAAGELRAAPQAVAQPLPVAQPAAPPPTAAAVAPPNAAVAPPSQNRDAESPAVATLELLAFHDRVREMSASELAREAARLGDATATPRGALLLAVVLAQTHNPGDLVRALALVEPLARSANPAVAPWRPFARWLAARYAEQRRLEEQLERQAQALRDQQRRLDQLSEKLEALRAIERSLGRAAGRPSGRGTTR